MMTWWKWLKKELRCPKYGDLRLVKVPGPDIGEFQFPGNQAENEYISFIRFAL